MPIVKTSAISLGGTRLGDTSQIVTFLTQDMGLVKCVAKGCRSKRNKFGSALEPFMLSTILFYYRPRRDLFTLSQADVSCFFPGIRKDLLRTACAQVPVDLLRHTLLASGKDAHLFTLARDFLSRSEHDGNPLSVLLEFLLAFCAGQGFELDLPVCAHCNGNSGAVLHLRHGRMDCACQPDQGQGGLRLSSEIAGLLREPASGVSTRKYLDVFYLLLDYLSFHVDKPLRLHSLHFLESVLD